MRGLGWDIDSPYSSVRGDLFPSSSFGHTGYTGTSIWIDPLTQTYIILLTNRVHPVANTSIVALRSQVANIVAGSIASGDTNLVRSVNRSERRRRTHTHVSQPAQVWSGLDVLVRDGFKSLAGKRVGLITNHTGIDHRRRRNVDILAEAPKVQLKVIFSPEHGLTGLRNQGDIDNSTDIATGLPVYSLYRNCLLYTSPSQRDQRG